MNPDDYEVYTRWINDLSTSIPLGGATMTYSLMKEKELLEKISKEEHMFAIVDSESNEAFRINGRYFDEVHMEILEHDFNAKIIIKGLPE